jgi:alkylation response protein AidB-like acyl-CoA dehydrogenase
MDFELDEDLGSVRDLAEQIFTDRAGVDRVVAVENEAEGLDRELWRLFAESGLLAVAVPEDDGGAGMGMLGLVTLLEQQGRRVAPVPLWSVVAGAALPLARFGSPEQKERWLPGLLDGSVLVTHAFDAGPGHAARVTARRKDDDLSITGTVASAPAAAAAAGLLVPVQVDDAVRVAVVPTDAAGVTVTPVAATNRESHGAVHLQDVEVVAADLLPGDGAAIVDWVVRRARVALAALQLGVCEEALRMTAAYTSERVQFGRPLSTNQAVAVRAADAYLDTEAIRLTTHRAAWLLDEGREQEAESAALVAKYWAARGGLRVVHATQHLHGGIGADVDYPIHRYFLWGRQAAYTLGGPDAVQAELGDALPAAPRIGAPA